MKKTTLLLLLSILIISCKEKQKEEQPQEQSKEQTKIILDNEPEKKVNEAFDIEKIKISTANLGNFPFINLPKGLEEMNKPLQKNYDICYFPINGVMTPFEGKLYKTFISTVNGESFSQHYFEKSMATYLESLGAIKIYDGEITNEEYNRYNKKDPNKGGEGDIGYAGQNINFWIIRSQANGNIYIQYVSNNAGASLNILQEEDFKQTITKITAETISSDLEGKGKSILYINFDSDKSTITEEGKEIVNEIADLLNNNKALKISVEGHTDNTGNKVLNKKLSNERANSVIDYLVKNGINKNRLSAKGHGAEQPLLANNSENNKYKNRRVEIIKTN